MHTNTIEYYEKRFGLLAVEMGFITPEDLIRAMTVQIKEDMQQDRHHRLIGEILLTEGLMSVAQIEKVLDELFTKKKFENEPKP